ncbi:MAG: hypothetical protein WA947_19155 [Phormidesmis sp.]
MKSIVKFPLLALLFLFSAETAMNRAAFAGTEGVTTPDSGSLGVGDTFSPGSTQPPISVPTRITNGIENTLNAIQNGGSVPSVDGTTIPVTPAQIESLISAITNNGPSTSIQDLEQQIATETGINVDISNLGASPADLEIAINSANELIMSLDSQQLAAAIESPTLMSLIEVIKAGNEALNDRNLNVLFLEGTNDLGLLKLSLGSDLAPTEGAAEEVLPPVRREEAVSEPQPPEPITTFQEPVRGLW